MTYMKSLGLSYSALIPELYFSLERSPKEILTILGFVGAMTIASYNKDKFPARLRDIFSRKSKYGDLEIPSPEILEDFEEIKQKASIPSDTQIFICQEEGHIDDAFTDGRHVFLGRNIVELLDRNEIKYVIAHEVAHIRHKDTSLALPLAIPMLSYSTELPAVLLAIPLTVLSILEPQVSEQAKEAILPISATVGGFALTSYAFNKVSRKKEYLADAGAVELTGDIEGGIGTLQKLDDHQLKPLNILQKILHTHPTTRQRIKALEEIQAIPDEYFPS